MNPWHLSLIIIAVTAVIYAIRSRNEGEVRRLIVMHDLNRCPRSRGLEIVKRHERTLRRGVIYTDLRRLEDDGMVCSVELIGDPWKRRCYWLTPAGHDYLKDLNT